MLTRTLMCRNRELLDFEVDAATGDVAEVRVIDESCLAQGVDAPSFVGGGIQAGSLKSDVQRLLRRRTIGAMRPDLPDILCATGVQNPTALVLLSHGCSLSDQYWYRPRNAHERWEDVNFFDNEWDPAFGNAVLARDWRALARASVETPDLTCSGWTRKAWVCEGGRRRLLKAALVDNGSSLVGELLVSRMLSRIMEPADFTRYEAVHRLGEDFSACDLMLSPVEEQVPADAVLGPDGRQIYESAAQSAEVIRRFVRALDNLGVQDALRYAARISVASTLALSYDQHLLNYGVIGNLETGTYRAAPLFDYGGAFGLGLPRKDVEVFCANPMALTLVIARKFSELQPEWDYSWYDPYALQDFPEEIEDALSAIDGLPAGYPKIVRQAFSVQLAYVNDIWRESMGG